MTQGNNRHSTPNDHGAAFRILDANLNRAREGLRVLEDFARFERNDPVASAQCKQWRHQLTTLAQSIERDLLRHRDTVGDVGTTITTESEAVRSSTDAVAKASIGRLTESLRCIEEYCKVVFAADAATVEQIRYGSYTLAQRLFERHPILEKLRNARLHLLLTESLCRNDWQSTAMATLRGGADVIQLREKALSDSDLLQRAKWLRSATRDHDALLIINDRTDIVILSEADGVHLGQDDLKPWAARKIIGPLPLIGVSTHNLAEAMGDRATAADYIGVGTMFASSTKPDVAVGGLSLLAAVANAVEHQPLVAIGGITTNTIGTVLATAPHRTAIAVSKSILSADDVEGAAKSMIDAITSARLAAQA